MKKKLSVNTAQISITSLEIAEITWKRHDQVIRDIEKVLTEISSPHRFVSTYPDKQWKNRKMYELPKREALILVSWYNIKLRTAIIDRLEKLEKNNMPSYQIENSIERAKKWITEQKEKEQLKIENKKLVKTKWQINNKKTAQAMQTAWVLKKENNKLKIELDESETYATVKKIELKYWKKFAWQKLKKYSLQNNIKIKKVNDTDYWAVNSYNKIAWLKVFKIKL